MRALVLLSTFLLLSGCLGGSDDAAESASADPNVEPAAASASTATLPDADANATSMAPMALAFTYSGSTPEGVCGPAGCQWVTQGAEDFHPLDHTGHPTSLTATFTYDGLRPGMEFYVGLCIGNGGSEAEAVCDGYTTGPSPLTVTFDLSAHEPGTQIALSTGALNGASTASGLIVFTSSSFEAAGTLDFAGDHAM